MKSVALLSITLLVSVALVYAASVTEEGSSRRDTESMQLESYIDTGAALAESIDAESLARLVEHSSAIVVVSHKTVSDQGVLVLSTPDPTPANTIDYVAPPVDEVELASVRVVVDNVLKNDGSLTETQAITYTMIGRAPMNQNEIDEDADAWLPLSWPVDTEFILFLDKETGESDYYIPYGACGRIMDGVTSGVTCSDPDRTVLSYMTGVSWNDFIDDIEDEVDSPSNTPTPFPTMTLEP